MIYGIESAMRDGVDDAPIPCCGSCAHWRELSVGGCGLCCDMWCRSELTSDDVDECVKGEYEGPCQDYEDE